MRSQKKIFLEYEGDNYYERNKKKLFNKDYAKDKVVILVKSLIKSKRKKVNILDIGCCSGLKLNYLEKNFSNIGAYGIDPSRKAILSNNNKKINLKISTADKIPFKVRFDIVILSFCLYLCDDDDLFKISSEVYRVLNKNSYIIIEDFIKKKITYNNYKHQNFIKSRKMNYVSMFNWHPKIKLQKKINYIFTNNNNKNNRISIALLKKK